MIILFLQNQQLVISNELIVEPYVIDYLTLNIDLSKYPFEDGEFEIIIFYKVLEHVIVDPLKCFGKLHLGLCPSGKFVLTTPNVDLLINFSHMLARKSFLDQYHPQNGIYGRLKREFSLSEATRLIELESIKIKMVKG